MIQAKSFWVIDGMNEWLREKQTPSTIVPDFKIIDIKFAVDSEGNEGYLVVYFDGSLSND